MDGIARSTAKDFLTPIPDDVNRPGRSAGRCSNRSVRTDQGAGQYENMHCGAAIHPLVQKDGTLRAFRVGIYISRRDQPRVVTACTISWGVNSIPIA